jgi:phosphate transport system substrate-binding protein
MKHRAARLAAVGAVVAAAFAVSASAAAATTLTIAGSTLVLPLVTGQFIPDYQAANSGTTVTDSGGGSTLGITDISSKLVDIGTSDAPMSFTQAEGCSLCVQIPWALSATGPDFNLSGVTSLKLTGPVLAAIYEGKITSWNDSRIASLNPGATLPSTAISVIYRSDGSGDTYVFTNYLSDVDPQWKQQVGASTQVSFPVGTGEKGNAGVAAAIKATNGAIGYVSTFYTVNDTLTPIAIKNAAGKYVLPYSAGQEDAADLVKSVKPGTEPLIVDPPYKAVKKPKGKLSKAKEKAYKAALAVEKEEAGAYPLSTFTDVIVRSDGAQVPSVQSFLTFAVSSAEQAKVDKLATYANSFAPLPAVVRKEDQKEIAAL